jgi:hypothetical protein
MSPRNVDAGISLPLQAELPVPVQKVVEAPVATQVPASVGGGAEGKKVPCSAESHS